MSSRFDWAATVLSLTFLGGLFLDGWAHTHGRVDETFFTPWHAVLYSGFFAMTGLLFGRAAWGRARGLPFRQWLPAGYALSLAGVGLWFVGGPFDLAWHSVFGFEANVEALLSPAHSLLALGVGLMTTGPLRAALRRPAGRWRDELPMILSLTCVVLNLTFFTQIAHPLSNLWAAGYPRSASITELGLVGMLLTTVIVVAPLLLLLRLDRLPAGGVTVVVGLDCFAMGFLLDHGAYPLVPMTAMVAGALAADGVRTILRPSPARPAAFRSFALALPVLLYVAYFGALAATHGIGYTVHLWVGVIVFAAVFGWLLSYVVLPPRPPDTRTAVPEASPRTTAKRVDPGEFVGAGTR
jgi:hypothetical protein